MWTVISHKPLPTYKCLMPTFDLGVYNESYFFSTLKCKANTSHIYKWGANSSSLCFPTWNDLITCMFAPVGKARDANSGLGDQPHWGFSKLPSFCPLLTGCPITFHFLHCLLLPLNTYLKVGLWFWMCALPILKAFIRRNAVWLLGVFVYKQAFQCSPLQFNF